VCPAVDGAISWNSGAYGPDTGLYYKIGQEWCQNMEAQRLRKPKDYSGEMYMSAVYTSVPPPGP
jgi:alcohol dehydrogenase (cytochrome c)